MAVDFSTILNGFDPTTLFVGVISGAVIMAGLYFAVWAAKKVGNFFGWDATVNERMSYEDYEVEAAHRGNDPMSMRKWRQFEAYRESHEANAKTDEERYQIWERHNHLVAMYEKASR